MKTTRRSAITPLLLLLGTTIASPEPPGERARKGAPALERPAASPGRGPVSADGVWTEIDQAPHASDPGARPALPGSFKVFRLDALRLERILEQAPIERAPWAAAPPVVLSLPMSDGAFARFRIQESPILEPELARVYPEIRTYLGQGLDDPTASARFDWTPAGFHAFMISAAGSGVIAPNELHGPNAYIVYDSRDEAAFPGLFSCSVEIPSSLPPTTRITAPRGTGMDAGSETRSILPPTTRITTPGGTGMDAGSEDSAGAVRRASRFAGGVPLRTFRIAIGLTGEYTLFFGRGTVAGGLAAVATAVNALDAILEREVAVRLVVAAGEPTVIFTDWANDPYTHLDVGGLSLENQAVLDSVIGGPGYDLGIVFDGVPPGSYYPGGRANYGACVEGVKGNASIVYNSPPGGAFTTWFLAHEVGHQFTAAHSFNGTTGVCGPARAAENAYEPASGSTIMAYPSQLCGFETLSGWDHYYHTASLEQITGWITVGGAAACGGSLATGNAPPSVSAGVEHSIPGGTPFLLTATGSDPDGDPVLYCWEEYDLGSASPPLEDNGDRPIFRSFPPTPETARAFPGPYPVLGVWLPTTTRTMNFRVTARDARAGGGGIATDLTRVHVRAESGPFEVTSPSGPATWTGCSEQTITWDVAGTDTPPIDCTTVKISFSADGGSTFPVVLASGTPNDGSESVTVPRTITAAGRIKVEAEGNVFFGLSEGSIAIFEGGGTESCGNSVDDDCDGKVDIDDPDCRGASTLLPLAGSQVTSCGVPPRFTWTEVQGARARVLAGPDAELLAPAWRSRWSDRTSFTPSSKDWRRILLLAGAAAGQGTIHWGVETKRGQSVITSPASHFVLASQPAPASAAPVDSATLDPDAPPTFAWLGGECNGRFRVELSSSTEFEVGIVRSKLLTSASWSPSAGQWARIARRFPGGVYWRIAALDGLGRLVYSEARFLAPQAPAPP